ncbi:MAG TPA: DcaP family trimeric outer membrane transporter [Solimonas sp.]|nr:DcaP family trimeric outer membrane transporter [Solimonas sp.]
MKHLEVGGSSLLKVMLGVCLMAPGVLLADAAPDEDAGGAGAQGLRTIPVLPVREPEVAQMKVEGVDISVGGFIKLDALYSRFSDGDVGSLDAGRDYFRPNSIPVASSSAAEDPRDFIDFHAKDTRFFIKADAKVSGAKLGGYLELDFRSAVGGATEVTSNSYNPRLRRAFFTLDNWLFGQEWTLFRNLDAHPDQIDDLRGPVQALSIVRQPQIRYTAGDIQVAIENSETNVQPRAGTVAGTTALSAPFVTGDSRLPDLTVRYNLKNSWGSFSVTALARQLSAERTLTGGEAPNNQVDGTALGYGLNVAGKLPLASGDDIRFGASAGTGIGRYVALATTADAAVDADGKLSAIPVAGTYGSYRHVWNPLWRSTATLASYRAEYEAGQVGGATTKSVNSAHVNALYSPIDKVTLGLELMHAIREVESGDDGTLTRLQFSAKYEF